MIHDMVGCGNNYQHCLDDPSLLHLILKVTIMMILKLLNQGILYNNLFINISFTIYIIICNISPYTI